MSEEITVYVDGVKHGDCSCHTHRASIKKSAIEQMVLEELSRVGQQLWCEKQGTPAAQVGLAIRHEAERVLMNPQYQSDTTQEPTECEGCRTLDGVLEYWKRKAENLEMDAGTIPAELGRPIPISPCWHWVSSGEPKTCCFCGVTIPARVGYRGWGMASSCSTCANVAVPAVSGASDLREAARELVGGIDVAQHNGLSAYCEDINGPLTKVRAHLEASDESL